MAPHFLVGNWIRDIVKELSSPNLLTNFLPITGDDGGEVSRLKAVIHSYEKEVNELGDKVKSLETEMEKKDRERQNSVPAPEKDKYKSLARRLKEERNSYKEMVEGKKKEQEELKVEIEKMTEIIVDLRDNCGKLQEELLQVRLDSPRRVSEKVNIWNLKYPWQFHVNILGHSNSPANKKSQFRRWREHSES